MNCMMTRSGDGRGTVGVALSLGINLAAGMALCVLGGHWLDSRRGGGVIFTVCGMVVGMLYCAYEVWKTVKILNQKDRNEGKAGQGGVG